MMLFGGRLSGVKPPREPTPEVPSPVAIAPALPTPHTDLIARLTDHELRLLDELDRTRLKLETEMKLKDKDRRRKPSTNQHELPVKDRLDMLPILTNTGDTPFEVGLHKGAHVLPVFRLPPVHRAVTPSAPPSVLAASDVADDSETPSHVLADDERAAAMEALGLTPEEFDALEQTASLSSSSPSPIVSKAMTVARRQRAKLPLLHKHKRRGRETRETLQSELTAALRRVQSFTTLVKQDLVHAQQICPVQSIRGELFVKKWGLAKINAICTQLLHAKMQAAFVRWVTVSAFLKQQQARTVLLQFKGSRRLDLFFTNWTRRRVANAWATWIAVLHAEDAQLQAEQEADAVLVLQRAWRNYHSRFLYNAFRAERKRRKRHHAACKIQAFARGAYARANSKQLVRTMRENMAATALQARARGFLLRKSLHAAQAARAQFRAARQIQALARGRQARARARAIHVHRTRVAAARILQRRYRGRLHKVKYIRAMIEREQRRHVIRIQRIYRGFAARLYVREMRERRRLHLQLQHASALKLQAVYRGHRGRLATQFQSEARAAVRSRQAKAATRIQALYRQRQAARVVAAQKAARLEKFVAQAREWTQFWSDDAGAFFFYHNSTGDAIWEPPEGGYTKADGRDLVLQDGRVLLDPAIAAQEAAAQEAQALLELELQRAAEEAELDDALCVECDNADASRRCTQCEDVFCDACYDRTHGGGKRALHTWTAMGPTKCVECEKLKATRWCDACGDPYCLGCYNIIHAKGKKAAHAWIDMGTYKRQQANEKQSALVLAMLQQQAGGMVEDPQMYNEYLQSADYAYVNQGIAHGASNDDDPWMTAVDETTGQTYYYNSITGETQWAT
ncbi:hypothetical protein SDRG_12619 [Saprolegnia diclina VS20]|uniref:WW domain-containing protein n=1 Tax=Saprolegnia diclina (strain VS20) TaxID=1156394 RepID=T0RBP8_SAPDV|nr:hypothetical protein SDRG_12619 [Saprolegnia diclina VS20]EQC29613.1 hypothetical protein SDRG_12619 [Saprolegnia diclina VS20]|eukprot:XP_008616917.1 hypothetical protein SDRG_12619 [Saprolegnia diclina VS20]